MKTKNSGGVISGALVGLVICMLAGAAAISLFAWMISAEHIPENKMSYMCTGVLVISTIIGAAAAVKKAKQKPLLVAMLTASAYFIVLIGINALFMDGMYEGAAVTALCMAGSSACAAMLSVKRKKTRKFRMMK